MTQTSGTNNQQKQHLIRTYSKEWYEKMIEIWRDRLDVMGIRDTGALRSSVQKGMFNIEDAGGQMTFLYLTYGIYVNLGIGNGYRRGNGEADLSRLAGSQPAARSASKAGAGYKKAAKNGGGLYFLDPRLSPRPPQGEAPFSPSLVQCVLVHLYAGLKGKTR